MSTTLQLQPEYGYVILVAAFTFVVNFAQITRISILRSRFNIDYPKMSSEDELLFNCAQRVHHNTLEQLPFVLVNLAFGGLKHPTVAASFGGIYIIGRILYSLGYWTGVPKRRIPGSLLGFLGGIFPLLGTSVAAAGSFIGWW